MRFRHPFRLAAAGLALTVAVFVVLHLAGTPVSSGEFLTWANGQQAAGPASPRALPLGALQASPSAQPNTPGWLGALRIPLGSLLQQLNNETRTSAQGQYGILQELSTFLRDRIEQFLNWVTAHH